MYVCFSQGIDSTSIKIENLKPIRSKTAVSF